MRIIRRPTRAERVMTAVLRVLHIPHDPLRYRRFM